MTKRHRPLGNRKYIGDPIPAAFAGHIVVVIGGGPSLTKGEVNSVRREWAVGRVKVLGNLELRAMFLSFMLFDQRWRLGTSAVADAGRLWADYRIDPVLDGTGLGLKYGLGGGPRLQIGETAPDFDLPRGDGTTVTLGQMRGTPVIVTTYRAFW